VPQADPPTSPKSEWRQRPRRRQRPPPHANAHGRHPKERRGVLRCCCAWTGGNCRRPVESTFYVLVLTVSQWSTSLSEHHARRLRGHGRGRGQGQGRESVWSRARRKLDVKSDGSEESAERGCRREGGYRRRTNVDVRGEKKERAPAIPPSLSPPSTLSLGSRDENRHPKGAVTNVHQDSQDLLQGQDLQEAHPSQGDPVQEGQGLARRPGKASLRP
jgi:hypothetical protein